MLISASYALRTAPRLEPSGMYTPQKAEGGTALGMAMARILRCGVGEATCNIIAERAERVMAMADINLLPVLYFYAVRRVGFWPLAHRQACEVEGSQPP